ncbi:hypothetical protein ACFLTN_00685 [Chloroflexota bacterium]
MTIATIILTLWLPLGILSLSIGVGLLTAAFSLLYQAKALSLEDSNCKKELARKIERVIFGWMLAFMIVAFGIGATLLWLHITNLLPTPIA